MEYQELREALARLGLSQAGLARLTRKTPRQVNTWATGASPVPGVVAQLLRAYEMLPPTKRAKLLKGDE